MNKKHITITIGLLIISAIICYFIGLSSAKSNINENIKNISGFDKKIEVLSKNNDSLDADIEKKKNELNEQKEEFESADLVRKEIEDLKKEKETINSDIENSNKELKSVSNNIFEKNKELQKLQVGYAKLPEEKFELSAGAFKVGDNVKAGKYLVTAKSNMGNYEIESGYQYYGFMLVGKGAEDYSSGYATDTIVVELKDGDKVNQGVDATYEFVE